MLVALAVADRRTDHQLLHAHRLAGQFVVQRAQQHPLRRRRHRVRAVAGPGHVRGRAADHQEGKPFAGGYQQRDKVAGRHQYGRDIFLERPFKQVGRLIHQPRAFTRARQRNHHTAQWPAEGTQHRRQLGALGIAGDRTGNHAQARIRAGAHAQLGQAGGIARHCQDRRTSLEQGGDNTPADPAGGTDHYDGCPVQCGIAGGGIHATWAGELRSLNVMDACCRGLDGN